MASIRGFEFFTTFGFMKLAQDMEDLSIRRLELHKVGVFKDLVLEFPRKRAEDVDKAEVHIFVGANGTGKTTLLEAMTFFRIGPMADYARALGTFQSLESEKGYLASKIDFDQNPHPIQIEFRNRWTCKHRPTSEEQPTASFPFAEYLKNYYFYPKPPRPDSVRYAFFAANGYRRFETTVSEPKRKQSIENPFYLSLAFESKETETEIFKWISNRVAQANQAQLAGNIDDAKKYRRHIAAIEDAVGKIIQRKIEFRVDFIKGLVECLLDGKSVIFEAMASGHQAILNFLLDLMYRLEYFPEGNLSHFSLFLDELVSRQP